MSPLEEHEAASLLPPLGQNAFSKLKADIEAHGQLEPIKVLNGRILDGRHRHRACIELGREPIIEALGGDIDPVQFVLSANLHRRHLSDSQRAMLAARALKMEKDAAKARQREHGRTAPGRRKKATLPANLPEVKGGDARDRAGDKLKVSGRSVDHAAKVIAEGTQQLVKAVDRGEISVSAASKIARLPKPKQAAALKARQAGKALQPSVKEKDEPPHVAVRSTFTRIVKLLDTLVQRTGGAAPALKGDSWTQDEKEALSILANHALQALAVWESALSAEQGDATGGLAPELAAGVGEAGT